MWKTDWKETVYAIVMWLLTVIFHSHFKPHKYCQTLPQSQWIPTLLVSFSFSFFFFKFVWSFLCTLRIQGHAALMPSAPVNNSSEEWIERKAGEGRLSSFKNSIRGSHLIQPLSVVTDSTTSSRMFLARWKWLAEGVAFHKGYKVT